MLNIVRNAAASAIFTALCLSQVSAEPVKSLRCEYLVNPLGIHETAPRFTWIIDSDRRMAKQTAYQVLVASSPEKLTRRQGDLWDSGIVKSEESAQVVYAGSALASRERCWWAVRVWDRYDKAGPWSSPAMFSMGLMQPGDWSAKWIAAAPVVRETTGIQKVVIIKAIYSADDGTATRDVTSLVASQAASGAGNIRVTNQAMGGDPSYQHRKHLHVDYEVNGKRQSAWKSLKTRAWIFRASAVSAVSAQDVRSIKADCKRNALYNSARRIRGSYRRKASRRPSAGSGMDRLPQAHKVSGAYDVTNLIGVGRNALGAMVANGWYCGHLGNGGFQYYGTVPALLAQLEITYKDGGADRIVTDTSWKAHAGPVLSSDLMLGESYDSRQELSGWDKPDLTETDWSSVKLHEDEPTEKVKTAEVPLDPQISEPVRVTGTIKPKAYKETGQGHWTFDLGQNMVGVVKLKVNAPAGTAITIRHAEMLNPDGTIYTVNLRGATSVDHYITHGGGEETWQPRFTFHGFRYVEISGLPGNTLGSIR